MDVALVIDSSSSVRRENFDKVKEFLVKLVDELDIDDRKTHVGVVRYNHKANLLWDLEKPAFHDKEQLKMVSYQRLMIPLLEQGLGIRQSFSASPASLPIFFKS